MFVGIYKWLLELEFDFGVVDSNYIVEIVGIFVVLVFVVLGLVVQVFVEVEFVVYFDVVCVGLWWCFIVQV